MNYRHTFHAGNFADVVKHAVLARIVAYLKRKPAAFRVIDTHAGSALYDLSGAEASRTGEWRGGIGRLRAAELAPAVRELLAPYLEAVAAHNGAAHNDAAPNGDAPSDALKVYPGSPALLRHWLRAQDRLVACEAEPVAAHALADRMRGDKRIKAVAIDGYTALNAYVPPQERRGLVLTDPPYEHPDEFARVADALAGAHRKWPTGIYMVWYPIKDPRAAQAFGRDLARRGIPRMLRAEVDTAPVRAGEKLTGSGLIIVNPPFELEAELTRLLPALAGVLAVEQGASRLDWLAGEK